jgi:hypothetical protein
MPANRAVSVDAWLKPKLQSNSTPAWTLWLLRTQIGVVYFFAGLTKLSSPDWLRGEPMRGWIAARSEFAVLGRFTHEEWVVYLTSYGGLALDLLIVPLLLWRRTRVAAFCLAVFFHLSNGWLFEIDIFPWLGIAATSLFFSPSWPRRVISLFRRSKEFPRLENGTPLSGPKQMVILGLVTIYISIQLVMPVRHHLTRGGIEWTYLQPCFSWQMMLRRYTTFANFYITDPNNGRTWRVSPRQHLTLGQTKRMGWRPDMVVQFAHYLASTKLPAGPAPLKVETRFFVSVHGRKPQLFIDPTVNLAAEPRIWGRPRWLLEVDEPLPPPGQENRPNPYLTTFEE